MSASKPNYLPRVIERPEHPSGAILLMSLIVALGLILTIIGVSIFSAVDSKTGYAVF